MPLHQNILPLALHISNINQVRLLPSLSSSPSGLRHLPLKSRFAKNSRVEGVQLAGSARLHIRKFSLCYKKWVLYLRSKIDSNCHLVLDNNKVGKVLSDASLISSHAWCHRLQHLGSQQQPVEQMLVESSVQAQAT